MMQPAEKWDIWEVSPNKSGTENKDDGDNEEEEEQEQEQPDGKNNNKNSEGATTAAQSEGSDMSTATQKTICNMYSSALNIHLEDALGFGLSFTDKTLFKEVVDGTLFKEVKFYSS